MATNPQLDIAVAQHHGHQKSKPTANPTPDATPSPSVSSTQTHQHGPEMQVPVPPPSPERMMNTPAPMPSPSSGVTGHMHETGKHVKVGSLSVMKGDEMGIRMGSSDTNVISMGAMGTGTSWQPSSGPMHMHHWTKGDWLLMFHYNLFAGVNRQGGPRGVTFRIGAYTFGGVRDVWTTDKVQLGIGSDLTFYSKPSLLDTIYGNHPISWKVFFRIRPARMGMSMHGMHVTQHE